MTFDLRALIFDLDGVIADTNRAHYRSWAAVAQEERIPFSEARFEHMKGIYRWDALHTFLHGRAYSQGDADRIMARKNAHYADSLAQMSPADALPGVVALLDEAQAAGLRLGLASSSLNARNVLRQLQLTERFAVINDGASVQRHKPAPDVFLQTAAQLGVTPDQAIVFEDSRAGVAAGLAGGFRVVGVAADPASQPTVLVPSLSGVTLAWLRATFAALAPAQPSEA
jgi:beta-phosphoglucomutase